MSDSRAILKIEKAGSIDRSFATAPPERFFNHDSPEPVRPILPRRVFLKKTSLGILFLSAAHFVSVGCARSKPYFVEPGKKPLVLTPKEFVILEAFVRRMFPESPGYARPEDIQLVERIDRELSFWDEREVNDFKQLLALFEHGPLIFGFSFSRFTELSPESQDRYIAAWEQSRLAVRRAGFQVLKMLSVFFYYTREEAWKQIRYPGPWEPRNPQVI